ncbi:hypothetical protein BGZ67_006648 [Mortierella alpina]|nr:hypothetical protein BGZ67_006648 [Mortierella alpina]
MSCSSSRAANVLSVAMGIPSRSKGCLSGLSGRGLRTRIPEDRSCRSICTGSQTRAQLTDSVKRSSQQRPAMASASLSQASPVMSRSQGSEASWEVFFNHSCGSGAKRSRSFVTGHCNLHLQQTHPRHRHNAPHRSFSVKACVETSTASALVSEGARHCAQREALTTQQSLLGSPPCIVVDNLHRTKKSTSKAQLRSKSTAPIYRQHHSLIEPPRLPSSGSRTLSYSTGMQPKDSASIWTCRCKPIDHPSYRRHLHSTPSKRSFAPQNGTFGTELTLEEKVPLVAELRQKALVKASVPQLWATYSRIVKFEAVTLLQSDDVLVLFQVLSRSHQSEEAMEMMLQVALDLNDIGKQLPQLAFDALMRQAVDHMPLEQVKAMVWQIQGRRRFIAELTQLCDSNAEIKTLLGLYNQLTRASFDVDGFSTYFQSRKDKAESLGDQTIRWIKDEGMTVNSKVVESLLVFLLDRHAFDPVFSSIGALSKEGVQFSHGFYTTTVHRFGRAQKFDCMDMTLELMRRQGLEPLEDTYSAIVDAHAKAGNLREAQRAYQDVLAAGLTPTDRTFGPMLEAVGKMGDYEMTRQLVDQMNASGVPSNPYTFSALLQSQSDDPNKSAELFKELSKQVEPNTVNYNLLIRTFQRHGDLDGAFRVFRAMIVDKVQPDQYTFSSILSLFATRGDAEGAEDFWNEMVNVHKVVPNTHAYGSLMHVYCTAEDMLSAQTVYREMIQSSIMPNEIIFGTLLNAYARRGDLTQMLSIYDAMRAEGLKPNSYIYSNLLFGLVKDGDMAAARRLYENMEEDGYSNSVLAQTILMKGYLDQGDVKESQEVYKNMLRSGMIPNFMTYATLLQAHAKRGEKREGRAFLDKIMKSRGLVVAGGGDEVMDGEEMTRLGITQSHDRADATSPEIMEQESLNSHFREGHLSATGTERKPLRTAARPMPLKAFTPLLDAYAKESNILAAKGMFDEIKARGLEPNTITYTMLMDGYRRAGDVESVLRIWDELFDRYHRQWRAIREHPEKYRPSKRVAVEFEQDRLTTKASKLQRLMQSPVSITLDALCYSGRVLEAKAIWSRLEQLGFEFDSANWNDYCVALARNGLLLDACQIVQEKLLPGYTGEQDRSVLPVQDPPELPSRTVRAVRNMTGFGQGNRRATFSNDVPLESIADLEDGPLAVRQHSTLLYPRPRTFAALADTFEDLLSAKKNASVGDEDKLSSPIAKTPTTANGDAQANLSSDDQQKATALGAKRLERQKTLIESRLQPYPQPFKDFEDHHRQILWGLIRSEYPRVLEVLNEGMLVAHGAEYVGRLAAAPSSATSPSSDHSAKDKQSPVATLFGDETTRLKGFARFRQWRRLKSVMKDMERKQFLEDRKSFIQEREERFDLLRGRKPT